MYLNHKAPYQTNLTWGQQSYYNSVGNVYQIFYPFNSWEFSHWTVTRGKVRGWSVQTFISIHAILYFFHLQQSDGLIDWHWSPYSHASKTKQFRMWFRLSESEQQQSKKWYKNMFICKIMTPGSNEENKLNLHHKTISLLISFLARKIIFAHRPKDKDRERERYVFAYIWCTFIKAAILDGKTSFTLINTAGL